MRTEAEANCAIEKYSDMVRRICFVHLKNKDDTEDVFQNVFLKYVLHDTDFQNTEHEKSWLIRVTINACKDVLKSFFRSKTVALDVLNEEFVTDDNKDLLREVLSLPEKYRDAIYLHYYEGYTALEIAEIMGKKENGVYTLLSRGRNLLKKKLGGDGYE